MEYQCHQVQSMEVNSSLRASNKPPVVRSSILFLFFVAALSSSFSFASGHSLNEMNGIYRLPAYVKDVQPMGAWAYSGKGNGQIRMAITQNNHINKVFVQWLSNDVAGKHAKVHSTVAIKEINQSARYEVKSYQSKLENGNRVIELKMVDKHNRQRHHAKITLIGLGLYKCDIVRGDAPSNEEGPL